MELITTNANCAAWSDVIWTCMLHCVLYWRGGGSGAAAGGQAQVGGSGLSSLRKPSESLYSCLHLTLTWPFMCYRLRVPALHAPPQATPSAGRSPHPSTQTLLSQPQLTHLRTHSWAWEGMSRRPLLRVSLSHMEALGCEYHVQRLVGSWVSSRVETICVPFKGPRRNLRNDLLIAADSITNTMSSLVKELNSGEDWWRKICILFCEFQSNSWWNAFSPQRVEVRLRALWIQTLDGVTYWPQPLPIPSSHTNQGTRQVWPESPLNNQLSTLSTTFRSFLEDPLDFSSFQCCL